MRQAPVPPGRECSIPQAGQPEKQESVRTINQQEQVAIEQAPFFNAFCAWLYRLAKEARTKQETPEPPAAA